MNKSVLMIMGGAIAIAILVAVLVQMKISHKAQKEVQAVTGTEVLVASKALMLGEKLGPTDVRWQALPESLIFTGMIKRKEQADENKLEVYDKPLRRDIMSGEPITTQALLMDLKNSGGYLAAVLAPGMRAVAVPVKAETSVAGFVSAGDFVDVILTYQVSMKGEAESYSTNTVQRFASETILSNVHVLAVDQNAKEGDHAASVAHTVTLEVKKENAQILAMATTMGEITLSLRHVGEKDSKADQEVPVTTDMSTSRVMKKINEDMGNSKTISNTVRLYSGSSVVNVPVRATPKP
jgi:pilus assembly protein CpaB